MWTGEMSSTSGVAQGSTPTKKITLCLLAKNLGGDFSLLYD